MTSVPMTDRLYQHQDGGFYVVQSVATSTDDLSQWVVYTHVWPFEQKQWLRRVEEWTPERFRLSSNTEMTAMMLAYTRQDYQQRVTEAKAARRAAKA